MNLHKASKSCDQNSSKSHVIFCLKIVALEETNKTATVTQLNCCDLAGAEKSKQTFTTTKTSKGASWINTSLLSLYRFIDAMIANQKAGANEKQVPYRDNMLTNMFQAYFEGRVMVKMVVNYDPSRHCFDESVKVLKFAAIAKQIQIESKKANSSKSRLTVDSSK